jgi:glycosyltransferase involved in cell wall biosynthesis
MKKTISIIAPVFNEEENINKFYRSLKESISKINYEFNIIFINDGSTDNSLNEIIKIKNNDNRVIIIDFTRNFGKQAALTAGIEHCVSDALITIDTDLQEPPEIINLMIVEWEAGNEIVHAIKNDRSSDSYSKRVSTLLFYKAVNLLSQIKVPVNSGDFKLIDRKGIEILKKFPEKTRWISGLSNWMGLKSSKVFFSRPARKTGKPMNMLILIRLAFDAFFSFSDIPLKITLYTGVFFAALSFCYGIKILINAIFFDIALQGYPSLMTGIIFIGSIQLIVLGIIGEYISRIFLEVKSRPIYLISKIYE